MKQTAVEWLVEQLENVDYNPLEKGGYDTAKKRIIEQAKEIEKQQMLAFGTRVTDRWGLTRVEEQYIENEYTKWQEQN
jgi:enolase